MKKSILLAALVFAVCATTKAQVVINEYLSANTTGFCDEDNQYNDWIELFNPNSAPINLEGYYLSDDKSDLKKWQFPSYVLPAKGFVTVFASSKNRTDAPVIWQSIITKGDRWRYTIPTEDLGTQWQTSAFDASGWQEGPSGFGYGDGDDSTTLPTCVSVFVRKTFEITAPENIRSLVLQMDYDDGFVAYINGTEVARSNVGTDGSAVPYNAIAGDHEALIYLGGLPENFTIANPGNLLVKGTNTIAIQGHNGSATSSDFTLIPFLSVLSTDNYGKTSTYSPGSSNYFHTNFKIDKSGESIYLASPQGLLVDSISGKLLDNNISYGRQPDGSSNLFCFAEPTPGAPNNTQGTTSARADSVIFSMPGGPYPGGLSLSLTSLNSTDKIFYTSDGSDPSTTATEYTGPINVTADCVIKACTYRDGSLPGPIVTNTYAVSRTHKFPITCISTNPANLWDNATGIYTEGPNAATAMPHYGANYWQDWEKPAQFEVYDVQGKKVIDQGVGVKIYGGYSRTHDQKSMSVFARGLYGKGALSYRFFQDKEPDQFESILLRNGGQDSFYSLFRDGLCASMVRNAKMDLDWMAYQPSAHYLNGQYWGILTMREKINEHYLADNNQFGTKDITLMHNQDDIVLGTYDDYEALLALINNNDLNTSANYQKVLDKMEVDNYIQYQLMEIYVDNSDWPGNNLKYWRVNTPRGKWRWIFYDADYSFGIYEDNGPAKNSLAMALDSTSTVWPNEAWSTLLFRRLLTSTSFRNNFVNQYCDNLNSTFLPANVNRQIDSLQNLFEGEVQYHLDRWGMSYDNWLENIDIVKNYANTRPAYAAAHLEQALGLGNKHAITINQDNAQGKVKLNSIIIDQNSFTGNYYENVPVTLKALPNKGYKFARWEGTVPADTACIQYNPMTAASFTPVFEMATDNDISVVINEINYKSATDFNTDDWVEIYNNGAATVDLAGWQLTDSGVDQPYTFPANTILYPGDYVVVCEKIKNFRNLNPSTRNSVGNFQFGLSGAGETINLYDANGILKDAVVFGSARPWPVVGDETGATIELINPGSDNSSPYKWRINNEYGTPGARNLAYATTNINITDGLLLSCFPNPFKNFTTISMTVPVTGHYTVDVVDIYGRQVKRLLAKELTPEQYFFEWKAIDTNNNKVSKGLYLIRCSSETETKTIKTIYIQ